MRKVENNFMLLMIPIELNLYYKTYAGLRWVLKGFTRPAMQTFYLHSWAFYTSYFIQLSFILLFTWSIFVSTFRVMATLSLAICIPFWIILTLYMNWLDKQNFAMNFIRKDAIEQK